MRRLRDLGIATVLIVGLAWSTGTASGAIVYTLESDIAPGGAGTFGDPYTPTFPSGGPSSTDIINGLLPTASAGNFTLESSAGLAALTNGSVTTFYGDQTGASNHAAYATAGNGGGAGTTVSYALSGRYNLTSIVIYGGWNDAGRDQQHYDVLTSTDGGLNYTLLATVDENPGVQGVDITPVSNRIAFTNDSGPNLATNVTHVRVNFLAVENGYTGYSEIDVFGTPQFQPGDADRNGVVNLQDFILISNNFSKVPSSPGFDGDVFLDNIVDEKDFRLWKEAFSATPNLAPGQVGVPEPSSALLFAAGLAAVIRARRRRS